MLWKVMKKGEIKKYLEVLRSEGVVVLPTDTVYGLFANAFNEKAVDKIFKIKKRPKRKPIGVFVGSVSAAGEIAETKGREDILKKYWPGDFTFVLKRKFEFPEGVGTKETIGIRIPKYPLFEEIFKKTEFPLAQTSANISGEGAVRSFESVQEIFKERDFSPDIIMDAGKLPAKEASTVVDLTRHPFKIIRKGSGYETFKNDLRG